MLPGIAGIMAGIGESVFSVQFLGYTEIETSGLTTYTFLAEDFGVPSSTREIFVTINVAAGVVTRSVSSATIGGIAATIRSQAGVSDLVDQSITSGIISAVVPSGTSGTIAVTLTGTGNMCVIGVYRVTRRTSLVDTGTDTYSGGNPIVVTDTVNVGDNGAVIAAATFGDQNGSITWVGVTETYDDTESGGSAPEQSRYSGALITGLATEVGRTISATQSSASPPNGAAMAIVSIN
ncbi:hypothetical protein [Mesorhizobium sp.]|uniref:hypothetical protein n=1 Tax=Mesorhizobium sp. TaxID=1871066 RepID=UPI000FE50FF9|nr:hypothetical protein [Mesorhizobium sp.]RWO22809.1 MAG: hypothetical protein EOS09_19255 [Mesorhizobium sp.]